MIVGGILVALLPWLSGGRDALAILVGAFGLALAVILTLKLPGEKALASRPLAIALAAWVGWGLISLLWSVNRYQTEWWLLILLLMILGATVVAALGKGARSQLVHGYIMIATAITLYGFYLYFTASYDRFTSTFYWANPAAAYLLPAIVISGWRWLIQRRWYDFAALLITATGFWLTDSRGAILVMAVLVAAVVVYSSSVRRYWRAVLVVAIVSFVLASSLAWVKDSYGPKAAIQPGSRFSEAVQGESSSISDRLSYQKSAVDMWWDRPLVGWGPGTYATMHPQYQERTTSASSDAHNVYLQVLSEQGIVGFSLMAWVLVLILFGVMNGVRSDPSRGVYALAALGLLLHTSLDINSRYPATMVLLAVLLALSYKPIISAKIHRVGRMRSLITILVVIILAISNYQSTVAQQNGTIHNQNLDLELAATSFSKANAGLMYNPDVWGAEAINYYVLAASNDNRTENIVRARDRAKQAIERDPRDAQHYFLLGRIERLDGENNAAKPLFERALAMDPHNHAEYYADLISLQLDQGELAAARALSATALARFTDPVIENRHADEAMKPAVAQILVFQAQLLIQQETTDTVLPILDRAKRLDPNNNQIDQLKSQLPAATAI